MAEGDNWKMSVIMQGNLGTALVFDFGYMDTSSGLTPIDSGIAAGAFQTLVQATLAAALPIQQTFKRYRAACVKGVQVGQIGYVDVVPAVTGSIESDILPLEICISMKRSTGHASRRDRGRIFFGAVAYDFRDLDNFDFCTIDSLPLIAVSNLLKANLTVSGRVLKPVILAADGTNSGNFVNHTSIAQVFTHHKSRRFRVGT